MPYLGGQVPVTDSSHSCEAWNREHERTFECQCWQRAHLMVGSLIPPRSKKESLLIQSRSGRRRTVALVTLVMPWHSIRICLAHHFLNFTQSHPLHAAGRAMMGYRRATLTNHHKRKFVEKDLFASLTCFHSPARESRSLIRSGYLRVNKMARRSIIDLCVAAAADSIKSL